MTIGRTVAAMLATTIGFVPAAQGQVVLDRVDPSRIEQATPHEKRAVADVPVQAPAPVLPTVSASAPVTVGAIVLSGLQILHPSDFADIFDIYVGRTLSPPALAGLADALAARARERGFVLATASIPPQPLTAGVLRVDLDEGAVDGIRVRGAANAAVERALAPLVGTGPVTLARLERRLLIAGDIDGLTIRRSRLVREGTRNLLEVDVLADRYAAVLGVDNSGSRPIGPIQSDLSVRVSQVLAADDLLSITALATPTQPREFGYARVRYAKRVDADGTEVSGSLSYSRAHPGAYLLSRDINGTSWAARLDLLHPLLRRRDASLWLTASANLRTTRQERRDILVRRDRLTVARIGVNGFARIAGGRLRASATASQGFDLFGATRRGDPLASRADADGMFTSLALAADWTTPIVADVSAQIAVSSQIAAQPLLIAEETGLGGGEFLRGYDYSERSGDDGVMMSGEVRWAFLPALGPLERPLLYGFVDGGRVTNLRGGFGTGTLFSVGGGIRASLMRTFTADVGIAVPLSGPRYDGGNSRPIINFRLTKRF